MIRKLRVKFMLITLSLITVILVGVLVGICLFFAQNVRQQNQTALEMALREPHGKSPPHLRVGDAPPEDFQRDPVFVLAISAGGQASLLMSDRIEVSGEELDDIAQAVQNAGTPGGTLRQYNLRYLTKKEGASLLVACMDLTAETRTVGNVALTCVLVGALAFAAFFVACLLLSRWALKPVRQAWQQQRRFVSDASHELKTPLTVILANTNIIKSHPAQPVAQQMKWVENTEEEARRMKGLVDDLLFLAKQDDVGEPLVKSEVNLSDVASHTALLFESKAYEQGVAIQVAAAPGILVAGNEPQLKQLVGILLDNAVKYSPKGGTVALGLALHQGMARLTVHNHGPVISEAEKPHLFDRFYRADFSRSQEGYGLGLSIAKSIVDAHKGKIGVDSSAEKGTAFKASLPLWPQ